MEPETGTDRIQVFVRVRPSEDNQCCFSVKSGRQIVFSGQSQRLFEFDDVADQDTTQESVFARVGKEIVESCVEGYNGTIFAYGQTGSGKTYTMLGPGDGQVLDSGLKGLIPRSLDYLFELMNQKISSHGKNFEYGCRASFLEIYNENIYDLLDNCKTRSINLRESQTLGVYAEGIIERNVSNSWEAWNILADGWRNRRVSQTAMNRESSRSHAVFTLTVETKEHTDTGGITKVRQSVLNLVDLAGSERQRDTQSVGLQLREAGKINRSLSVLGQVIMALDEVGHGKTRFVPYRESKLTFLLRDSLGGNTKTFVIVNIHPNTQYLSETVSSLYFAQRAKQIRNRAKVNENTEGNVLELQNELKRLKKILAKYEIEGRSNAVNEENGDAQIFNNKNDSNYREKFIWAMAMLEQREETIKIHETQIEKLKRYNMSRNFILKLRDAAIAAHEKGKTPTNNEEIVALKKEIEKLKEQIIHHPDKARYQAEISLLHNELKSYRNDVDKVSQSRVNELKNLYTNLLQQNDSLSPSFFANRASESDEADRTMLDNLKQTIKEYQQEIETLRESKQKLLLELNISKSKVDELNKIIDNDRCQASTQLNKFIDMHNATLEKVIGTPTRKRASLALVDESLPKKNKLENVPCAKLLDLSIPDSLDTPVETESNPAPLSIMDQSIPDIPGNEMEEALREELQQMSEELKRYQQMCFKKDEEMAAKRTTEFGLNEKLTILNEANEKLKKNLLEISEDFRKEKKLNSDAKSEITKLKTELKSLQEKSLACNKEFQVLQESFNSLEAKYFDRVTQVNSLVQEIESKNEKIQRLTEDCETKSLELDVIKNRSVELIASYESEKQRKEDLMSELEATKATLVKERHNYDTLVEELEGEAKEVAEEITTLRETNANLSDQNENLQNQLNSLKTLMMQKVAELEEGSKNMDQLRNTVQSLRDKVQEHEDSYSSLEADKCSLQRDFDELLTKFHSAADKLDKCNEEIESLEKQMIAAEQDFQTRSEKHKFELECVQEDLIDVTESASKLELQLLEKRNDLKLALEEQGRLQYEIDLLNTKKEEAENHVEVARRTITQMDEKLKHDLEVERMYFERKYEKKMKDATTLKDEMAAELELVSAQLTELTKEIEQKRDEITRLKHLESEKENLYQGLKMAASENKALTRNLEDQLAETTHLKELAEKEASNITKKNEELMGEVASLAGHHNHQQKIRYVVKIKEQLQKAESKNIRLDKLCQKLLATIKKHDGNFEVKKNIPEFNDLFSV